MASIETLQNEVSQLTLLLLATAQALQQPVSDEAGKVTLKDLPAYATLRMADLARCQAALVRANNELARVRAQLTKCRNTRR